MILSCDKNCEGHSFITKSLFARSRYLNRTFIVLLGMCVIYIQIANITENVKMVDFIGMKSYTNHVNQNRINL